jgi:2-polyprenyl-3-methyl-5-hydroxy-6-metoxy-1,4-benzoquinol methylase
MNRYILYLTILLSKVFGKASNILSGIAQKYLGNQLQEEEVINSTQYNMVSSENEPYYADQYWAIIQRHLNAVKPNSKIVDLGCSQGRFTIKLAKKFPNAKLVGCDLSREAILYATEYAKSEKVNNVEFRIQNIKECINSFDNFTIDLFLMIEVAFFYPEWKDEMAKMLKKVKPGGLIVMSFRSLYFYALLLTKNRLFENLNTVINKREGSILNGLSRYSWNSSYEIIELFTKTFSCDVLDFTGIGSCSGIPGDPHAHIVQPGKLFKNDLEELNNIEEYIGEKFPDAGRYMLLVAKKAI